MSDENSISFLAKSLIGALTVNAWYQAMSLHVSEGKELTPDVRQLLWKEVCQQMAGAQRHLIMPE